jgi:hypothetical protein
MKQTKKESKALWKLHFAKQITLAERGTCFKNRKQHLDYAMCKEIENLAEGVFNRVVLQNLVTKLATSFNSYKPDKQVMTYLHQHMRALQITEPLNFTNPKDRKVTDRSPRHRSPNIS